MLTGAVEHIPVVEAVAADRLHKCQRPDAGGGGLREQRLGVDRMIAMPSLFAVDARRHGIARAVGRHDVRVGIDDVWLHSNLPLSTGGRRLR